MTLTKENVCVFIENEAQLQEAKELLEKYGEEIAEDGTFLLTYETDVLSNFLQIFAGDLKWCLLSEFGKQITLSELETILKNEAK